MTLGIKQYLLVPTSTIPEKGSTTSRVHLTFYNDINSIVGTHHYLVPRRHGQQGSVSVDNKAR